MECANTSVLSSWSTSETIYFWLYCDILQSISYSLGAVVCIIAQLRQILFSLVKWFVLR